MDFVTGQLAEAATIAVVGVAVVMTALTILMLAIMVLTRLAPGIDGFKKEARTEMGQTLRIAVNSPLHAVETSSFPNPAPRLRLKMRSSH
jgi:Na+-transporting methylmalonyl-CoA/oxaloacetate decarboxylase gamma subunit